MDSVEYIDSITNMHVLATGYASPECAVEAPMPFEKDPSEIFEVEKGNNSLVWQDLFGITRIVFLCPVCFLFEELLIRMPSAQVLENFVEKATEIFGFLSGAQKHHGCQTLLSEELVQETHRPEVGRARRMHHFHHLESIYGIQRRDDHSWEEAVLNQGHIQSVPLAILIGKPVRFLLSKTMFGLHVCCDTVL